MCVLTIWIRKEGRGVLIRLQYPHTKPIVQAKAAFSGKSHRMSLKLNKIRFEVGVSGLWYFGKTCSRFVSLLVC